jgi:acetyltransferase EpsM
MKVLLVGTGALAREAYDWVRASGHEVVGFFSDRATEPSLRGLPIHRSPDTVPDSRWVAAVGTPAYLERLVGLLPDRCRPADGVVHPFTSLGTAVRLGPGSLVAPGSTLSCDITLGTGVIVNPGCTVGHDCVVEDFAVLAPNVSLAGLTRIGRGAFLGASSCTLESVHVAPGTVVGAGAVVTKDAGPGTYVGVPARRQDLGSAE